MESSSDLVRLNEEPSDGLEMAWNDYESDSADSWKTKEFVTLSFKELSEKQAKLKKVTENKNDKPKLKSQSITNSKSVISGKVHENQRNEKRLAIANEKGFNYDNNQQFYVNSRLQHAVKHGISKNIETTTKRGENPEKNSHAKSENYLVVLLLRRRCRTRSETQNFVP
uniref:Uncharacterized protein n=1 Tax=Trichogramma kaykai TaxID=54128 RepID=A0ABD2WJ02_9HYME